MAAMRSIAAFGVVKRKCVGTRSRRSRRSIPVSHILYNVPTPGRRARRPGVFMDRGLVGWKMAVEKRGFVKLRFPEYSTFLLCFPVLLYFPVFFMKKVQFFQDYNRQIPCFVLL